MASDAAEQSRAAAPAAAAAPTQYNMYRKAAFAIVIAWMAKTRSLSPIYFALKTIAAVAFVGAAGAALFLLVPNHLLVPSSKYRKTIAAAILVWSAKTRSFYPIKLALKAAGACAFLVAGFLILLAIGAVLVFKYGPPPDEEKKTPYARGASGAPGHVYAPDEKIGAQLGNYTDSDFQGLLDSVPEEYRLKLIKARRMLEEAAEPGEKPSDYENESSEPHPLQYSLIESAPMSIASFRNNEPILVEVFGLTTEEGRKLNGKRGWVQRRVEHRLRVWFSSTDSHEASLEELRRTPSCFSKNIKTAHLRLCRSTVAIRPVTEHRLLSGRAGDIDNATPRLGKFKTKEEGGFFVFFPGLRNDNIESFDALRCCPAEVGNWGGVEALSEEDVRHRLLRGKRAWDPLDGPGWPGIYDDKRRLGLVRAAREDVARRPTFREACELWCQIDGRMAKVEGYQPYVLILRCRFSGTTEVFREGVEWLVNTCFRDRVVSTCGLSCISATVVNTTGFVVLASQGGRERYELLRDITDGPFCFSIDDRRIAFESSSDELSEKDVIDARDKPKKREFQYFKRSPCGRFTFTSWWPDGSNYPFADALLEMRGDAKPTPPVREKKSKFGHTSHFAYGPSNCRITPDILGMHEDEVRAARKRWAEKAEAVGRKAEPSSKPYTAPDLYGEVDREEAARPAEHPASQHVDDYFQQRKREAEERYKQQERDAPNVPSRPWKYQDVQEEGLPDDKRAWTMDGDKPLESLFEGLRKMGCNVETGGGDGGFRFSYGGSDGSAKAPSKEKQERMAREHAATFEDRYPDAPDHPMFEKARKAAERAREPMVSLETPLDELLDPATSDDRVMPPPIIDEGVPESKESMPSELRENYM